MTISTEKIIDSSLPFEEILKLIRTKKLKLPLTVVFHCDGTGQFLYTVNGQIADDDAKILKLLINA